MLQQPYVLTDKKTIQHQKISRSNFEILKSSAYLCMSSAASLKRGGKQDAILLLRGKIKVCFAATASSKLQPAPRPHRTRVWLWKASTNVDNVLVCWSTQSHDVTSWGWPYRWVVKSAAGGRSFPSDHCLVAKRQSLIWKERKKRRKYQHFETGCDINTDGVSWQQVPRVASSRGRTVPLLMAAHDSHETCF